MCSLFIRQLKRVFDLVVYGKQPGVLAGFNRKKEVVSVIFIFGETTFAAAVFRHLRPDIVSYRSINNRGPQVDLKGYAIENPLSFRSP